MNNNEGKDWTLASFEEGRNTLRTWREESVRRSEETVELWEHVLSRRPSALGDELWVVYEQVCISALDCARLDVANECAQALQKKFSGSQRVMKLQAMRLEAMEKYEDALNVYDTLIQRDETNAGYRKRRVAVLKAQGKIHDAIKELNDYLKKFINDNEAWMELSLLYLSEMDYPRAAHCLEELILSQPFNSLYLQRYADIKYTQGGLDNVELAKQYFTQAARLNPGNLRALYGVFFSCNWLSQKATGQKRKELVILAGWATEQIVEKYQTDGDQNPIIDSQIKTVNQMMNSLKISTAT